MKIFVFTTLIPKYINRKLNKIMATLQELNQKVDALQVSLDAEQAQVAELILEKQGTIDSLNARVAELQAIIDSGVISPEQLQEIADKIDATKADLEGTV